MSNLPSKAHNYVQSWKPLKRFCDDPYENFQKIRTLQPGQTGMGVTYDSLALQIVETQRVIAASGITPMIYNLPNEPRYTTIIFEP